MGDSMMRSGLKILILAILSLLFTGEVALAESQARWSLKLRIAVPAREISLRGASRARAEFVDPVAAKMAAAGLAVRVREAVGEPDEAAWDVEGSSSGSVAHLRRVIYRDLKHEVNILDGAAELNVTSSGARNLQTRVVIAANPSTGYRWMAASESGYLESAATSFLMHTRGVGVPQHQVIHLRSLDNRNDPMKLSYRRPWEKETARMRIDLELDNVPEEIDLSDPDVPATPAAPPPGKAAPATAFPAVEAASLPYSWDWRSRGIVAPIRDQGQCGSCWAFGTAGIMESALWKNGTPDVDLSEQFLVSCNTSAWDCNGGLTAHMYHFDKLGRNQSVAGAVTEAEKPYTASNGTCAEAYGHPHKLSGWQFVVPGEADMPTVEQIKAAIHTYGPVTAGICSGSGALGYTGGIFATDETSECAGGTNHQIILVGWDDNGGDGYWILRNSWGPSWGIDGYMHIRYNTSRVGEGTSWVTAPSATPTFTLDAVPPALVIGRGGSGTTSLSSTVTAAFSSAVALSAGGLPSGVTATFSPAIIAAPGSGSSTLTFSVAATAPAGSYPVTITGTGGGVSKETTVTLTVATGTSATLFSDGFEGEQWPNLQLAGTTATWSITGEGAYPFVTPHGGFSMMRFNSYHASYGDQTLAHHTAGFSIPSDAGTVTLKFWMYHDTGFSSSSDSVRPHISTDGESYAPLAPAITRYDGTTGWAEVSVDLGSYRGHSGVRIGFLGTSGYGNDMYLDDVTVVVGDPGLSGFSLAASPATVTVHPGSSGGTAITTAIRGAFSSTLTLSATGLPSGVTASFSPDTIASPGSGTSTLTFNVAASTAAGRYPVTIIGTGAGESREITVVLITGDSVLFSDGFEGTQWPYLPLTGGATAGWSIVGTGTHPAVTPHGGVSMLRFNSYDARSGDQALTHHTTTFSIPSSATTVTLKFWMYHDTGYAGARDLVLPHISTGGDFIPVGMPISRYDGTTGWTEMSADLTGYKGESSVRIGFAGASAFGNDIYLDDVTVVAADAPPGFSLAASPAAVAVPRGSSGGTYISTRFWGGFDSDVTLSVTGLPSGATASFSSELLAPYCDSSLLTLNAASAAAGIYPVTVTGVGGGVARSITVTLAVTAPAFTLAAEPATVTVPPGKTKSLLLTITCSSGFDTPLLLTASGLPAGVTATFDPAIITAPGCGASTVTFGAAGTAPVGAYRVKVSATGGGTAQGTVIALEVGATATLFSDSFEGEGWGTEPLYDTEAEWSLGASGAHPGTTPHSGNMLAALKSNDQLFGGSARIYRSSGLSIPASGKVTLSFWMHHDTESPADDWVLAELSTDGVSWESVGEPVRRYDLTTGWSKATVDISAYKGESSVRIGFLGASADGNDIYLDDVSVETWVVGDFTIAASSPALTLARAGVGTVTVTTSALHGFDDPIDLGVANLPAGVTFTPATIPAPGTGSATVTLRVSTAAAPGSYPVTITVTGGGVTKTAALILTITEGSFTMALSPARVTVAQGGRVSTTLSTTVSGAFDSGVTLTAPGLPAGITAAFSVPAIGAPGEGSVTVTLHVSDTLPAGTYPVTLAGTAGNATRQATVTVQLLQSPFFSIPYLGAYHSFTTMYGALSDTGSFVAFAGNRTLNENVTLDRDLILILKGGYDSTFTSITGTSTIDGKLVVRRGKLVAERLVLK